MDEILEKKKKQLGIYAKVAAGDSTSLLEYMLDIEEYLDSIKERFDEITKGKLRDVDYERIISESVGRIPTPKDGEKPSPKELIDIILPLIPEVKDGNDAVVDYEKIISEVVSQIHIPEDGKDGKDGSPDTSEDIRNKLELLEGDERLSVNAISGLDKFALVSDLKNIRTTVVGGGSANVQVLKNGMPVGSGAALDFRGAGIASVTHDGHTGVITITGGGGGGAAWGAISGTLSNQTDLNNALSDKLDVSDFNLSTFDTGDLTEGSNLYFTDERAQDAVGTILVDSGEIDFTYNDGTPSITAGIVDGSIDEIKLDASVNASLDLADTAVQNLPDLGITATAAEINVLDGITASTTELNYTDGVTSNIQSQLNIKEAKAILSPIPVSITTAAGTAAKVGTTSGGSYTPAVGDILLLNFTNSNTAYNPTLNIDGSGDIAIRVAGQQPTNLAITGTSFIVYYDGTYYEALGSQRVSDYNPVTVNTEASFVVSSTSPVNANSNYFHIANSSSRITYNLAASTVAYASLAIIGKGSGGFRVAPASGDSVYMDDQVITYPGYIDIPQGGYIKLMSTTQNDVWTVETYIGEAVTDAGYNFSIATLGKGGTGASLSDPNADRLMFWDDSNGKIDWLTVGTGLNITGTTLTATGGETVTFGSPTQIPYTNGSSDDFSYTSGFTFDGTDLEIPGGIRLGGNILDANGNEVIEIVGTASAVNQISVTNSAAGDPVEIAASGGDTDISLVLQPKGAGVVNIISPEITVGSDAQGDTYYRNGSGGFTRLPIGTAGQVLAVNSGATAPEWVPASSGSVPWTDVTGTSQAASVNNGYLADNAAEVTITLPATFAEGDIVIVVGKNSGGYKVQAASGDEITLYTTPSSSGGHVQGQQGTYTRFVASIANQMWIAEASSNTITLDGAVVPDITTNSPEGFLVNGKIVVTVSSNNITVALKQMNGSDATSSSPIYIRLNDSIRAVTGALSVTKNAGTNWFNAGSSELATKEIDYFVYLGYNATDGVVIGFCRFPYMNQYSQFSTTSTNERYCAISTITNATSTDYYAVIGRFAATLSAGAGYTWSVPTFTAINLINRPIFETRLLVWTPTYSGNDSMTFSSVTTYNADYRIYGSMAMAHLRSTGTTGGTASTELRATMPFGLNNFANALFGISVRDTSSNISGWAYFSSSNVISGNRYDAANFGLGANRNLDFVINYDIS